jgi:protein SCO1
MKLCRLCAAVLAVVLTLGEAACRPTVKFNGEVVTPPKTMELAGVNWDGKPFRLSEHRGKVAVVFFGYTFCPDVCPFTLAKMKQLRKRLGAKASGFDVVFVSVDPKRDTLDKLAHYVPGFDPSFYGLRVEAPDLDAATEPFDVSVRYGLPKLGEDTPTFYYVDHTATFFVIDRTGRLRLRYPPNATLDQMQPDIEKLLAEAPQGAAQNARKIEVRNPRVTLVPPTGAIYLTVVNPGPEADRLLRVETAAARLAETHESRVEGGLMRMVARPEGFAVPAGGTLELKPGGKHVMLVETSADAATAATIPVTLHFERAGAVTVQAAVQSAAMAAATDGEQP